MKFTFVSPNYRTIKSEREMNFEEYVEAMGGRVGGGRSEKVNDG